VRGRAALGGGPGGHGLCEDREDHPTGSIAARREKPSGSDKKGRAIPRSPAELKSSQRYVLKDFPGSSHRILAAWIGEMVKGSRLLELGPFSAHVAQLAGRPGLSWVGLEGALDCLPALVRWLSGAAIVELDTLARLPAGYDAVLAADTLEHLPDPERILAMIHRALKPGGLFFISVPNVANLTVRLALLCGRFEYGDRGILDRTHRVFFTRASLDRTLERAGFQIERRAVTTIPLPLALPRLPRPLLGLLSGILRGWTRLFPTLFGYQLLAVARRPDAAGAEEAEGSSTT
jgi:SAM-dependent methyltransferase